MSNKAVHDKFISLRSTIAWMDLVMANVNESILVLDTEWRIIFANTFLAEMLNTDRVMVLGKLFWEIVPLAKEKGSKPEAANLPISEIASLNGVYDLKYKSITWKLSLQGQYVPALKQAVCIISDVSLELQAEKALMELGKEVERLKRQIKLHK